VLPVDFLPSDLLSQPVVLVPRRGVKPHQCEDTPPPDPLSLGRGPMLTDIR
jgi:hypothetical protein